MNDISNLTIGPVIQTRMTYDEAVMYCLFCDHNGYRDWRLPTWDEYCQIRSRKRYSCQNEMFSVWHSRTIEFVTNFLDEPVLFYVMLVRG